MGSAKISNAKPQLPMETTDKKSIKTLIKSFFHKDKKKERAKNDEKKLSDKPIPAPQKPDPVASILENFQKLDIERKMPDKGDDEDDELNNFTVKLIEEDRISIRMDSHSSEDSGFSEINEQNVKEPDRQRNEEETNVLESLEKLKIDDKPKKKKLQIVVLPRRPVKAKVSEYNVHPYSVGQRDQLDTYRQISQINQQTLSGGQVIVNPNPKPDNYSEVDIAFKRVEQISQNSQKEQGYWQDVLEVIEEDTKSVQKSIPNDDFLSDFAQIQAQENFETIVPNIVPNEIPESNPIEEFSNHLPSYEESVELSTILNFEDLQTMPKDEFRSNTETYIFPTPPRSENVPSPMSESQISFYPSNSDYTLSPERSSPIYNSDYEKYQEISQYDDCPSATDEKYATDKKTLERTPSMTSMKMKQFKNMQKEIAFDFSKKNCCQINKKSCKEILQEHMQKLKMVERKNLCLKVSKLDLKTAFGVLHHIVLSLSRGGEQEDLQYALFGLVCERVLAQKPALFAGDFGLSVLKSAALRCPHLPFLTRYLVQCIRAALRQQPALHAGKEYIFHEVDAQGDTLVIACARAGDACASVLAEITRTDEQADLPPLFRIHHTNADGYTALHLSCTQHSASASRLHTIHILLDHASADIWKGDVKGGDTALHLAVNSANCDLRLIMMLFKHIDRKLWKKLAHCQNMSSVTPLEYARSATKSTTRQNYPQEVLDFLKKCR